MDDMLTGTTISPLPGAWMAFAAFFLGAANGQPAPLSEEAPLEVRIQVLDANTGAAIPSLRFLRGTPAGNVSGQEFRKKYDVEVANWQPHLIAIGKDGEHVWPLSRAWDRTALRIEADGYIPRVHTWRAFEKMKVLRLKKWGRVEGKVTLGAKPGENLEVTLGTQSEEHAHPGLVAASMTARSDAEGQFTFEHVPPGTVQVSLFDFFPAAVEDAPFLHIPPPPGAFTHVEVKPGTTARVDLGGKDLPALREVK